MENLLPLCNRGHEKIMSNLYQNVLTAMLQKYDSTQPVESTNCTEPFQCSTQCLSDIFRVHKNRSYNCQSITSMYVLRFCNRYSSEIYHILNDLIPRLTTGDLIFSIGCGSCMETIGIEKYCRDNNILGVYYEGIDSNAKWQNITNTCCVSSNYLTSNPSQLSNRQQFLPILPNIKILLLNYMLSDYKNHNPSLQNYLRNYIEEDLNLMNNDTYLIINDQNHSDEWEDDFDNWVTNLNSSQYVIHNYFYDPYPKNCNPRGKRMPDNSLIFSNLGLDSRINYFQANLPCCESGITIIHKL